MKLIVGGAGYIGSHTCTVLHEKGEEFIILDNFSNSSHQSIDRLSQILGYRPLVIEGDVQDTSLLDSLLKEYPIRSVIHYAAYKYMGESINSPLEYYDNNLTSLMALLKSMKKAKVYNLLFSSSCGVYGSAEKIPVTEATPKHALNPYGWSKVMCERILQDLYAAEPCWNIAMLRYFNPIGAHESGLIGEEAKGIPNMLLPYLLKVAAKELPYLKVMGGDYPTIDGTPVRDYIHIMDLAEGHYQALEFMKNKKSGLLAVNLGTGTGYSVLQMIKAFEEVTGLKIPYKIVERREGDAAQCWANPSLAKEILKWEARRGLTKMLEDAWRWQCQLVKNQGI